MEHRVDLLLAVRAVQHPLVELLVDLMVRAVDLRPMVRSVVHTQHRLGRRVQDSAQAVVQLLRWRKHRQQFQVLQEALILPLHGLQ